MDINKRKRTSLTMEEMIKITTDYNAGIPLKDIQTKHNLKSTQSIYSSINKVIKQNAKS